MLENLYSKDRITASNEPAKFVSSYCYKASGTGEQLYYNGTFPALGLNSMVLEWEMRLPNTVTPTDGVIGCTSTDVVIKFGTYIDSGKFYLVFSTHDGGNYFVKSELLTTLGINNINWHKYKIVFDRVSNLMQLYINDIICPAYTTDISSQAGLSYGAWRNFFRVGSYGTSGNTLYGAGTTAYRNIKITIGSTVTQYPLQGSGYDISGGGRHLTNANAILDYQDDYHYNLLNGFDKYSKDGSSPVEYLYVPYVGGVPIVAGVTGYTKVSSHPAGKYHNGAETKIVVGTNGTKDVNGWQAVSTVKDKVGNSIAIATADPQNVFVNTTTGYCIEKDVNTLPSVSVDGVSEYVFIDKSTANKYKNLLWYRADNPPTYTESVKVNRFIGNNNLSMDENGNYLFDENGFVLRG